jgi:hypothetical protein
LAELVEAARDRLGHRWTLTLAELVEAARDRLGRFNRLSARRFRSLSSVGGSRWVAGLVCVFRPRPSDGALGGWSGVRLQTTAVRWCVGWLVWCASSDHGRPTVRWVAGLVCVFRPRRSDGALGGWPGVRVQTRAAKRSLAVVGRQSGAKKSPHRSEISVSRGEPGPKTPHRSEISGLRRFDRRFVPVTVAELSVSKRPGRPARRSQRFSWSS